MFLGFNIFSLFFSVFFFAFFMDEFVNQVSSLYMLVCINLFIICTPFYFFDFYQSTSLILVFHPTLFTLNVLLFQFLFRFIFLILIVYLIFYICVCYLLTCLHVYFYFCKPFSIIRSKGSLDIGKLSGVSIFQNLWCYLFSPKSPRSIKIKQD